MSKKLDQQILEDAHNRLKDPNKWCQGVVARMAAGCSTYNFMEAERYCAFGSILRSACKVLGHENGAGTSMYNDPAYIQAFNRLAETVKRMHPHYTIGEVNDKLGYDAIMECMAEAINAG
jgi:hypothetical protein